MPVVLTVLTILGPIFGISKLVGKRRARSLELWLLGIQHDAGRSIQLAAPILIQALFLWALVVAGRAIVDVGEALYFSALVDSVNGVASALVAIVAAQLGLGALWLVADFAFRGADRFGKFFLNRWVQTHRGTAPWFLRLFQGNYHFFRMAAVVSIAGVAPLFLAIEIAAYAVLLVVMLPFFAAEWLRRRVNPESEGYLDILAYATSFVAMVLKLATD